MPNAPMLDFRWEVLRPPTIGNTYGADFALDENCFTSAYKANTNLCASHMLAQY